MTGFLVFAHGSSVESANDAVRAVSAKFAAQGNYSAVETAFLEGGKPDLLGGFAKLIERGADRVVVLPYFLTLGLHLQRDLPKLIEEAKIAYPELSDVRVTEPLDGHAALTEILLDRARTSC